MIATITGIVGLITAGIIIFLMRRDRLHAQHGFSWIVVAVGLSLLGFSPGIFDRMAVHLSVAYPPVLALFIAVILLVLKILLIDIERSRIESRNQRLVQRLAMLETELRILKEQTDQAKDGTLTKYQNSNHSGGASKG